MPLRNQPISASLRLYSKKAQLHTSASAVCAPSELEAYDVAPMLKRFLMSATDSTCAFIRHPLTFMSCGHTIAAGAKEM